MVALKDIRVSNSSLKSNPPGLTALFVGATSGIGLGTLKQLAKNTNVPKVFIVGRSKTAAAPILAELQSLNPEGKFIFIESEISLIKNVDIVSEEIKRSEKKLDLLFLSPGYLSFGGRDESTEGIDIPHALRYYSRLRFVYNLLPLLNESSSGRVVSILAGGNESPLDVTDLEVRNDFSFIKAAKNGTTQTTLAFEELALSNPKISFVHKFPGLVNTGVIDRLLQTAPGILYYPAAVARLIVVPIVNFFSASMEEGGERGLFVATSSRYPPAELQSQYEGTVLPDGVEKAQASVVKDGLGNGVYRLNENDESVTDDTVMGPYRIDGTRSKVWETTLAVWDRAIGRA